MGNETWITHKEQNFKGKKNFIRMKQLKKKPVQTKYDSNREDNTAERNSLSFLV